MPPTADFPAVRRAQGGDERSLAGSPAVERAANAEGMRLGRSASNGMFWDASKVG